MEKTSAGGSSVKDSEAILDRYIELGGNFLDTANFYTKGHSEKIIGDHLAHDREKRDRVVIATKFSGNLYPGDPNGGGSNRKSIIAQCEQSLRRLRTDYIDLYWLHNWDKLTPIEETMAALNDLVQSGKVRYVGVSDTPAWKVAQANTIAQFRGWPAFVGMQIEYSLLERTVEGELIPLSEEMGIGVTPWSPLKSGILSGKYTKKNGATVDKNGRWWAAQALNDHTYTVIDELETIAKALDTTVARVALAWVQGRPAVSSTIIGARSLAQLEDNLKGLDVKLTAEHSAKLDELTKPKLNFPADFLDMARAIHAGGTTINGYAAPLIPFGVTKKGDHY